MSDNTQLRKQLFDKQDLGDHARDTQGALNSIPRYFTKKLDAYYTEPMALGSPVANIEPQSIRLERITNIAIPETPVLCGEMVHYNWKPQNGGAIVTSIDGLTPSTTVKYRFVFEFKYAAKASAV
jgi:hypothetical protein